MGNLKIKLAKNFRLRLFELSELLDQVPDEKFKMYSYTSFSSAYATPEELISQYNDCGTTACALGWAPSLGKKFKAVKQEDWSDYVDRVFGINEEKEEHALLWSWLFNAYWKHHDNTSKGAAARIRYYLFNLSIPVTDNTIVYDTDVEIVYDTEAYKDFLTQVFVFKKPEEDPLVTALEDHEPIALGE